MKVATVTRVVFKLVHGPGCQTKIGDSMTVNRILIGNITLMFSFYFKFIFNVAANTGLLITLEILLPRKPV